MKITVCKIKLYYSLKWGMCPAYNLVIAPNAKPIFGNSFTCFLFLLGCILPFLGNCVCILYYRTGWPACLSYYIFLMCKCNTPSHLTISWHPNPQTIIIYAFKGLFRYIYYQNYCHWWSPIWRVTWLEINGRNLIERIEERVSCHMVRTMFCTDYVE